MSPAELQKRLQAVEPAAVLVAPAVLDKIIRQSLKLPAWMWTVPHRRSWIGERQFLFRYVEQEELLVRHDQLLPPTLLLLQRPAVFEKESDAALLRSYWRLLFHAAIDLELANRAVTGQWTAAEVQARIDGLGASAFNEIHDVLRQEHQTTAGADRRAVLLEFIAVFLELYYFARPLLESYFPGMRDIESVKAMLCRDVDGDALFERTRLAGAADPNAQVESGPDEAHEYFYELIAASDSAQGEGNLVRAAILRSQAARVAPAAQAAQTRMQAVALLERLVKRLQPALEIPADEFPQWSRHLPELLDKADQGSRPSEAYLLYDLQKVCLDFEEEIYTLDLVEWLLSAGKKPVRRPLSSQRYVRVTRHVRSAAQRLTLARMSENDRKHFAGLLGAALVRCEERVRAHFRPIITTALEDVGLGPRDVFERTAFLKLTEELLDRVLAYGFLTFSDLRDALARNRLKLPDLSDPQDFLRGDPLLRLDRRLATLLDGVYRRGEIYLRVLERFTALNFGTRLGRLITRFVTVPFGGAYLIVQALNHFILHPLGVDDVPALVSVPLWVGLGFFLLALLHSAGVRRWCADCAQAFWRPIKGALLDLPLWLVRNTLLMEVLSSWTFQLLYWYVLKPLVLCLLLGLIWPELFSAPAGASGYAQVWVQAALVFLAANFLVNSRPGKAISEALNHGLARSWAMLRSGLIPGLIRLVVQVFKHVLHMMEAVLFTVDEYLRFRRGDSRLAMLARLVLGVVWFPISYLARFNMVVLVEPGLNPVKFPVCSIAAKVIYPISIAAQPWLLETFTPFFGAIVTYAMITWLLFWLPDVFGFLFFEMKENWSLYQANRGAALKPTVIGTHGETMRRLLQPGFHSGTIPKLFARLRRAEQSAMATGNFTPVRAWRAALDDVGEAVRLFVTREFLGLLQQDEAWATRPLKIGAVRLATNQVQVELLHERLPDRPAWLEFQETGRIITAGVAPAAWLRDLSAGEQHAIRPALKVLFELAGADSATEFEEAERRKGVPKKMPSPFHIEPVKK